MRSRHIFQIAVVLLLVILVAAASPPEYVTDEFAEDPYLKYRPPFVRSLPVQIFLTGIVLTLTAVLLIHLVFTAQYHWPLAPVNYVLQIAGVTTLLISLIATIHVVLSASREESESWPYMLSYIAVEVPPNSDDTAEWSVAETATWAVMTASTSGLVQITHIQFLTLLYPSRLEKQLIFALLGPLAVVAAVMQLIPINPDGNVNAVSSDVKNVCNATLSLLFTVSLFIWGLLINRKQAWRTDGGTAVFGGAALVLALVSTALNFLYVHRGDEYVWLPGLMWAVVLWQSFLGWWWWVGAGSGSGLGGDDDMEEKLRKEAKRENRRQEAKERRQETKKRAKKVWRDVTGALGRDTTVAGESSSTQPRPALSSQGSRVRTRSSPDNDNVASGSPQRNTSASASDSSPISPARSVVSSSLSSSSGTSLRTLPRLLPGAVHRFYASIRRAHLIAAQKQTAERVQRIRAMERNGVSDASTTTWGVGNLLWRTKTRRDASVGSHPNTDVDEERGGEYEMDDRRNWRRRRLREDREEYTTDQATSEDDVESGRAPRRKDGEEDEESVENRADAASDATAPASTPVSPAQSHTRPRSLWWWGPLERWRLQDSTTYS